MVLLPVTLKDPNPCFKVTMVFKCERLKTVHFKCCLTADN